MKKIFIYALTTFFLVGCLVVVPKSLLDSGNLYENARQKENITFIDIDDFDNDLSGAMLTKTQAITIKMLASASVNEIPERLNKWLSAISAQKGRIYIEPKTTSTSSTWALDLLPKVYNKLHKLFANDIAYNSASDYNATIFYHLETGMIKKVVFSKK